MICSIGGLLQKTGAAGQGPLWIRPKLGESLMPCGALRCLKGRNMKMQRIAIARGVK